MRRSSGENLRVAPRSRGVLLGFLQWTHLRNLRSKKNAKEAEVLASFALFLHLSAFALTRYFLMSRSR